MPRGADFRTEENGRCRGIVGACAAEFILSLGLPGAYKLKGYAMRGAIDQVNAWAAGPEKVVGKVVVVLAVSPDGVLDASDGSICLASELGPR